MIVSADALILVADGEKALFLRNEGDEIDLQLTVDRKKTQENPPTRDQAANRRGRMHDGGGHKSAVEDTDWHELAKDRFASQLADILYKRAHANEFEHLYLVASPNTLGELRKNLHKEVEDKIVSELAKDLTNHAIEDIEGHLNKA